MIVLLVPTVVFITFITLSFEMQRYLINLYKYGNSEEKGFILIKRNEWEVE